MLSVSNLSSAEPYKEGNSANRLTNNDCYSDAFPSSLSPMRVYSEITLYDFDSSFLHLIAGSAHISPLSEFVNTVNL